MPSVLRVACRCARGMRHAMAKRSFATTESMASIGCPRQQLATLEADTHCFEERSFLAKLKAMPDAYTCGGFCEERMTQFVRSSFEAANSNSGDAPSLHLSDFSTALGRIREQCEISRFALDGDSAVGHFEKADVNGDGEVTWPEFFEYVRNRALAGLLARQMDADARKNRHSACMLSQTPLLKARVQELIPSIDERGMHENRVLLFGGSKPAAGAVLLRTNDYLQLAGHPEVGAAKAEALLNERAGEERRARVFTLDMADRHRAFERRVFVCMHVCL